MDLRKKVGHKISLEMIKNKLGTMDRQKWIVILLLGVLLLVIAMPVDTEKKSTERQTAEKETEQLQTLSDRSYEAAMEERLKEIVSGVRGVGEVEVMVTLEDGGETVIAKDTDQTSSTITRGSGSGTTETEQQSSRKDSVVLADDSPYETKQIRPKIRGVCVVAEGAGDDAVKLEIYKMIQALFGVDAHKIAIVEMGS